MAFESLTDKLQNVFKKLKSKGRLTEEDVKTKIENGQYGSSGTYTDALGNRFDFVSCAYYFSHRYETYLPMANQHFAD